MDNVNGPVSYLFQHTSNSFYLVIIINIHRRSIESSFSKGQIFFNDIKKLTRVISFIIKWFHLSWKEFSKDGILESQFNNFLSVLKQGSLLDISYCINLIRSFEEATRLYLSVSSSVEIVIFQSILIIFTQVKPKSGSFSLLGHTSIAIAEQMTLIHHRHVITKSYLYLLYQVVFSAIH